MADNDKMAQTEAADAYVGAVVIDVNDVARMTEFWRRALGYDVETETADWAKLVDPRLRRTNVSIQLVPEPRAGKNRLHLDLYANDQRAEVQRLLALGATHVREPSEGEDFVVLADPEGNLFCVIDKSGG